MSTSFIDIKLYIVLPTTIPNIVCLLSNQEQESKVMKNYEPFVLGPSLLYAKIPLVQNVNLE